MVLKNTKSFSKIQNQPEIKKKISELKYFLGAFKVEKKNTLNLNF
jgi:hypothetical protein